MKLIEFKRRKEYACIVYVNIQIFTVTVNSLLSGSRLFPGRSIWLQSLGRQYTGAWLQIN